MAYMDMDPMMTETTYKRFMDEARRAGFRVNWFTWMDGTTVPTVYGSIHAIQPKLSIPLRFKQMGNAHIVYPAEEK